jgi:hypothetical protein
LFVVELCILDVIVGIVQGVAGQRERSLFYYFKSM